MNSKTTPARTFPSHLRKRVPNRVRKWQIGLRKMIEGRRVEVSTGIHYHGPRPIDVIFLSKILTCFDFSPQILDSPLPVTPVSKAPTVAAVKSCPSVPGIPVLSASTGPRILWRPVNRHVTITWSENEESESFDERVVAADESCPPLPMTPVTKTPTPPGILLGKNHANRRHVSVTWCEQLKSFDKSVAACKKACPPLRKKLGRRTLRTKAGVAWKGGTLNKISKTLFSCYESSSTPTTIEDKEEEADKTPRRSARIAARQKKNQPLRRSPRIAAMKTTVNYRT